jgi:hypothetical protein
MTHKITSIHAYIAEDKDGEGLCAFMVNGQWIPMVAADEARLESLHKIAKQIKEATGKKIKLIKFSWREDIGEV